jgi:hypothetical protein
MARVKCYLVRLKSLTSISDKACKAVDFSGNEAILPKSQIFGMHGDSHAISEWILEQKNLQYSYKKSVWIDRETYAICPKTTVTKHIPKPIQPKQSDADSELIR